MGQEFVGKVALVTGAANGMGRATAIAFAKAGASVVVADIDRDGGNGTLDLISGLGGRGIFVETDVSKADSVENLVNKAVGEFGAIDCAVNHAAIQIEYCLLADIEESVWDKTIAVNQKGMWLCLKYQIRQMLKQGGGTIVNTASIAGVRPDYKMAAYDSTKFGVIGLTKAAAKEYSSYGIRINAVLPGAIRTPMLERGISREPAAHIDRVAQQAPAGRVGEPEEIAEACLWLCSPASSYVFGALLPVDGGFLAT